MKDLTQVKPNSFIDLMGKVEKVGHMLVNQEFLMKDSRQRLSVPEPFRGFMSCQDLI